MKITLILILSFACLRVIIKIVSNLISRRNNKTSIQLSFIGEFEMEMNNGGFNQYFFNSSGVNCFKTLKDLRQQKKTHTAELLKKAIILINSGKLSEQELIAKIKNREVLELEDDNINKELDKLDLEFYKYPDGELE